MILWAKKWHGSRKVTLIKVIMGHNKRHKKYVTHLYDVQFGCSMKAIEVNESDSTTDSTLIESSFMAF